MLQFSTLLTNMHKLYLHINNKQVIIHCNENVFKIQLFYCLFLLQVIVTFQETQHLDIFKFTKIHNFHMSKFSLGN